MQSNDYLLDAAARAQQKQSSRLADEHDLRMGLKSAEELRSENEAFAQLAFFARADLSASRSLG